MRKIIITSIVSAAIVVAFGAGCTTKIVVVAPTMQLTPTLTAEQLAYVQSVATQAARPTETPVSPTSTPVPPTQTPVVIYVPAPDVPASGPSSGEAGYLATLTGVANDFSRILTDLARVSGTAGNQPSLLFTSSWQSSMLDILNEGRSLRSRVTALNPSARLAPMHQEFLAALDALDGVDREMRAAIDDINAGSITSATGHIQSATQFVSQVTSHVNTATALLPAP